MYRAWSRLCRVGTVHTTGEARGCPRATSPNPSACAEGETISLRTRTLFLDQMVRLYPTLPLVVMGQSFGGALCARLAAARADLRGALLLSPACADAWARRARWLACLVYKWRTMRFAMRSLRKIGPRAPPRASHGPVRRQANSGSVYNGSRVRLGSADGIARRHRAHHVPGDHPPWHPRRLDSVSPRDGHAPLLARPTQTDPVRPPWNARHALGHEHRPGMCGGVQTFTRGFGVTLLTMAMPDPRWTR